MDYRKGESRSSPVSSFFTNVSKALPDEKRLDEDVEVWGVEHLFQQTVRPLFATNNRNPKH
ncbi:MAG: hypothetical protein V3S81_02555, partial [Anaerolineales bacterium]